ncbi:MAG: hypothetical protein M1815_001426 [Lichina confinis]|nr:MAG: hypothetical protein M1815_001426 [Lichina confinis]
MPRDTKDVQKSLEALSLSAKPDASKSKGGVKTQGRLSAPKQVAESWDEDLSSSEDEDTETEDLATAGPRDDAADFPQAPPPTPVSPRMPRGGLQEGGTGREAGRGAGAGGEGYDLSTTGWPDDMPSPSKSSTTTTAPSSFFSDRSKRSSVPQTSSPSLRLPSTSTSATAPSPPPSRASAVASSSIPPPPPPPPPPSAASSPPPSSILPSLSSASAVGGSSATRTRPEKTDAVARRMIAGALGVRPPKKTDDEREYERATKEKEMKRRQRERDAAEAARREVERARAAVWED